jgi:hypothetical protein
MSDIAKNNGSNVPSLDADYIKRLMSGIAESRASTVIAGGKPFFRLLKSGKFVFGQTNEEVQQGSKWAVNIMSMQHGWSCWVDGGHGKANELAGQVMAPMTAPKPARPDPIEDTPFKEQRSFEMKCLNGDDAGTEVQYTINSVGGFRAIDGLLAAIYDQLAKSPGYPCPVLCFSSETYIHKKYGEIAVPIFQVMGWADMNGNLQGAEPVALPVGEKAFEAAPARKRKAALDAAPQQPAAAPAEPVQPAPTAQTHIGQRRRPAPL